MKGKNLLVTLGVLFLVGTAVVQMQEPITAYASELENIEEVSNTYVATAESEFEWEGTTIKEFIGSSTNIVIPAKATAIANDAFKWSDVVSVSFAGNNVAKIGDFAFYGCGYLTSVTLPNSLQEIGSFAFANTDISKIVIPQNVTVLGVGTFDGCHCLTKVDILGNLKKAGGTGTFGGCTKLETVNLSNTQTTIPEGMFYGSSGLKYIVIPDSVTTIGSNAFLNCGSLTSVTFGKGVTSIGIQAFSNCDALESINIPSNVSVIGSSAFEGCGKLKNVTLNEGVKEINFYSFKNCDALEEITIPKTVELVDGYAFKDSDNLTKITVLAPFARWSSLALEDVNSPSIYGLTCSTAQEFAVKEEIPFFSIGHVPGWCDKEDGKLRYYDNNGKLLTNQFFFDGKFTYYLQADGTMMKDRLTYHPDGEHIIYFDSEGHEVFNAFQYCPSVGYTCYFDSQGYLYKDQITFVGDKVFYLNANGKMEDSGWFQFANGVDYGYAEADGSLRSTGFGYDPYGRVVFYHWNGMVARGLITDGVLYYLMDYTDGHFLGSFPVA